MLRLAINNPSDVRVQPFLRWAGSKRQIMPLLSKYWDNQYSRYVEPFAGSASFFFHLSPSRALLGDINKELISTYEQVKHNLPLLLLELQSIERGRENYLRIRALDSTGLTPAYRAARFIYLNRYCFNGLYRTNKAGKFNVPYGGDKAARMPSNAAFEYCSLCLQKAELIAGSFEKTLEKVKPGDFVYMDPPFSVKASPLFNDYDPSAFDQVALQRLREWLMRLDSMKIPFLVSYAESDEAYYLAQDFHSEKISVRRNISGFIESRRNANELLISNKHQSDGLV